MPNSLRSAERSKYTVVALALETDVRAGHWDGGKMPSVRKVAAKYGVSVVTASRALQVLRDKGLIRTIERSGCYRVPPPDAEQWAIVLRLTAGPMVGLTTALVRDGFMSFARIEPMHLHFEAFDVHDGLTVADAFEAATVAKQNGIKGVAMLPSRSRDAAMQADINFVEGCQKAGLVVCLYERSLAGSAGMMNCDLVAVEDLDATVAAVQHLYDTGCQTIACVTASDVSSHRDRVAGYLLAHHRSGSKLKPIVLMQDPTITPGEAYFDLATHITKSKIDGIVCYSDYAAIGIMVELQRRGQSVPDDIAIVGFDNLLIGEQFPVQLTTIGYSATIMSRSCVLMLRNRLLNPERSPFRVGVPGELIIRSSTASARS